MLPQPVCQGLGQAVHPQGDTPQSLGAMVHGVHTRHDRQEDLRRANVAGGLVAADVLFTGLERHAQCRAPLGVFRHADDPTGHGALVFVVSGEERGMRSAVSHRDTKALRIPHDDVRPPFAGWLQQGKAEEVGRDRYQSLGLMGGLAQ